ncbi:MAG: restriction endonuclease [Marivirga sp.]|nr:restriction endonuclease [Marivirga sp.]
MEEMISRPPRTIMEVYKTLPEGTLAELINGVIYMSPSPVRNHQKIVTRLAGKMDSFTEQHNLGEVFVVPFDVYLDEHANAVQPDIVFVAKQNFSIIEGHIHGVPDLVVEVLSEGNKSHDLIKKKDLYQQFGIREYWVIDPETKEAVGFEHSSGMYHEFARDIGKLPSKLLKQNFEF